MHLGKCRVQLKTAIQEITGGITTDEESMLWTEHYQTFHRMQCRNQAHLDLDLQPRRCLSLFLEGIGDRLHRGFKEFCDVFSVQAFEGQYYVFSMRSPLPSQLELTRANIILGIFVAYGSELDVLRIISVAEPQFCGLVENLFHLLDHVRFSVLRVGKFRCGRM